MPDELWEWLVSLVVPIFLATNAIVLWRASRWQREVSLSKTLLNVTKSTSAIAEQASKALQETEEIRRGLLEDRARLRRLFDED